MRQVLNILVLTLYSGENELDQCIEALRNQTFRNIKHKIFRDLPNLEAHRTLYETIMKHSREYDLFIKLDADMVLSNDSVISEISKLFSRDPNVDHAVFAVKDWYSRRNIMGMHVFSRRARWKSIGDRLFVDPNPDIPGSRKLVWDAPAPVAEHSPDPSIEEAYLFGAHRALKIVQPDRSLKHVSQSQVQWELLQAVWSAYLRCGDMRRGAALYGAETVFAKGCHEIEDKSRKMRNLKGVERVARLSSVELKNILRSRWSWGIVSTFRKWRWVKLPWYTTVCLEISGRATKFISRKMRAF